MSEQTRDESVQKFRIERGPHRYFSVYEGEALVVIAVYRKGAEEVVRRLTAQASTPISEK